MRSVSETWNVVAKRVDGVDCRPDNRHARQRSEASAARHAAVAKNEAVVLTTAPDEVPSGVIVRRLEPRRTLAFELLWRDEVTSPALSVLISLAAVNVRRPSSTRTLAAVA